MTWRQIYRQNQANRLAAAAAVAVRQAEALEVRPRLTERLASVTSQFVSVHSHENTLQFRTLLFCELVQRVRLSPDEKGIVKATAVNTLISQLRSMPSPPLRVYSDAQMTAQEGRLQELIETAYSLRVRPSVDLIGQLARFMGTVPGADNTGVS